MTSLDAPPRVFAEPQRTDPRIVKAADVTPTAAAGQRESPPNDNPVAPPVHMPGNWQVDLRSMAERPDAPDPPDSEPEPDPDVADRPHPRAAISLPQQPIRAPDLAAKSGTFGRSSSSPSPTGPSIGAVPITCTIAPPLVAPSPKYPDRRLPAARQVTGAPRHRQRLSRPQESAQELVAVQASVAAGDG